MNCTKCGAPLKENAKFCTKCGQRVAAVSPANGAASDVKTSTPDNWSTSDVGGVNGRIYWNIQPGQIARVISEAELDSYKNVRGVIIPEGSRAYIRANGRTIASISGGSYEFSEPPVSFFERITNGLRNAWNFVINLFSKVKDQHKPVDEIMYQRQQQLILENAKNGASFSIIILLEKAFPLYIGAKRSNPDDYKEIIPMKIQTQYLDMELILNAYFKISDYKQFILHYLTERTRLNTTTIVNEITDTIRRAIQDTLWDKDLTSNIIPNELYVLIKDNINTIAKDTFFGLSLVRIVEISSDNKDIDRFRELTRELYLSEKELDYLHRSNDFKNRLADTVNAQRIKEARTELELKKVLDEINMDNLLHDNEIGKFVHVLVNERIVHDAQNDAERDAALTELYKSDLLRKDDVHTLEMQVKGNEHTRMHTLDMMRLYDDIEYERVRLEGNIEQAVAVSKHNLAMQGLVDEYEDKRFYKEIEKGSAVANADLDIEQRKRDMDYNDVKRVHDMAREDVDAQFQRFMAMKNAKEQSMENQRRHEAELEKARLKNAEELERIKWENAKDLSDEKVWALKGGEAASVYAANKYNAAAEREANERLAAQKREDEARLDRERALRDAEHRENQAQMFQMMRDMMAMAGGIQTQKLEDRERQMQEKDSRLLRQEERMDMAYDRALDYTTKSNTPQKQQPTVIQHMELICPECGAKLESGTKFCADCGTEIG